MKRISQLPYFDVTKTGFKEMAVTVPVSDSSEEIRRVNIGDHCFLNENDAMNYIKSIY